MLFVFCTFMESGLQSVKHNRLKHNETFFQRSAQYLYQELPVRLAHRCRFDTCTPQNLSPTINCIHIFTCIGQKFFTFYVFFWFYFHFSFCQNCRFPVAPIHHWLQPFNSSRGTQPPPTSSPLYEH